MDMSVKYDIYAILLIQRDESPRVFVSLNGFLHPGISKIVFIGGIGRVMMDDKFPGSGRVSQRLVEPVIYFRSGFYGLIGVYQEELCIAIAEVIPVFRFGVGHI